MSTLKTSKTNYVCSNCSYQSAKWLGRCPNCSAWNSFTEVADSSSQKDNLQNQTRKNLRQLQSGNKFVNQVFSIEELLQNTDQVENQTYRFATDQLNEFWGGGVKAGSLTLLSGEPGLGKSTFAIQLLRSLSVNNAKSKLLYITAEESVVELARRAKRLQIPKNILLLQSSDFETIETKITRELPTLVVIDSVQTIYSTQIDSNPGSVSQVSTLTNQLMHIAKTLNIAIVLIGHVTKEGQIAGPKTLEHMVDSVLLLERSDSLLYRTLSFTKHRFGSTENLLLLKMEEIGLSVVTDPSLALLENLEAGTGICYGIAMDKNLPFVVEIQALVSSPVGNGFGRREAIGIKSAKLNVILAICEKYLNINLKERNVYLQLTGVPKTLADDSLDLPVLLSILSSLMNREVKDIFGPSSKTGSKMLFSGRLTFSGNLRTPTNEKSRNQIATKLGFEFNKGIVYGLLKDNLLKYFAKKSVN